MRCSTVIFVVLSLCLISEAGGQNGPGRTISLAEAVDLALENNESIKIARNDLNHAGAQVREAWADALPDIRFGANYTRNFKQPVFFFPDPITGEQTAFRIGSRNSYQLSLNVEQTLYQSGKVSGGIKAARLFREYSEEGFRSAKADITLSVKRAFYTVQLNEQLVDIERQSLEQQHAHLVNTRKLFQQGQVSELDTLRAWVDYTNIQPRVIRAENSLRIAENRLKDLLGLDLDEAVALKGELTYEPATAPMLAELQEEALRNRPDLRQLEYESAMRETNIGITRSDLLPKLFATGVYQSVAQSDQFDFGQGFQSSIYGGLRLEIPIFNGMRTFAQLQQAKLEYRNAEHRLEMSQDNLRIEVKNIFLSLQEAEKRIQVQQHAIKQAERALYMAERRYNEGVGTQIEIGDALLALNLTRTNYIQAVYDYKVALAELNKAVGRD